MFRRGGTYHSACPRATHAGRQFMCTGTIHAPSGAIHFLGGVPTGTPHRSPVRGGEPLLRDIPCASFLGALGVPLPPYPPQTPPSPKYHLGLLETDRRGRRSPQAGRAAPPISDLREGNRGAWGVARSALRGGHPQERKSRRASPVEPPCLVILSE